MIIFGPLIIPLILSLFIAKETIEACNGCFLRNGSGLFFCFVILPFNLTIALLHFAFALCLASLFTVLTYPIFIVGSVIKFAKIMRYWSSGSRFKGEGKVKAELFMRRSSSQSYGRRPTYHIRN
jgi:hypothetical protein